MLALSPRWVPVCAQNNGSVWQNIFAKKTSLVNYWGFSLNSGGSGAEVWASGVMTEFCRFSDSF